MPCFAPFEHSRCQPQSDEDEKSRDDVGASHQSLVFPIEMQTILFLLLLLLLASSTFAIGAHARLVFVEFNDNDDLYIGLEEIFNNIDTFYSEIHKKDKKPSAEVITLT